MGGGVRDTSLIRNSPPPRTLRRPYAKGPMEVLGRWVFFMSEVPLYVK